MSRLAAQSLGPKRAYNLQEIGVFTSTKIGGPSSFPRPGGVDPVPPAWEGLRMGSKPGPPSEGLRMGSNPIAEPSRGRSRWLRPPGDPLAGQPRPPGRRGFQGSPRGQSQPRARVEEPGHAGGAARGGAVARGTITESSPSPCRAARSCSGSNCSRWPRSAPPRHTRSAHARGTRVRYASSAPWDRARSRGLQGCQHRDIPA